MIDALDYYSLSKDQSWLEPDNPDEIGGRDTDVSQIAGSLYIRLREIFPINEVPPELVSQLGVLRKQLELSEEMIGQFISAVSLEVINRDVENDS